MEILTLIIKQEFFDQIMSGEKKFEYRETSYKTERKYLKFEEYNENGETFVSYDYETTEEGMQKPAPRQYDAIRFYVGYHSDRDTALVRVKSVKSEWIRAEDGKYLVFGLTDEEQAEGVPFWVPQLLTYELGEIIEKKVKVRA